MKRITFSFYLLIACALSNLFAANPGDIITLDLSKPLNPETVQYNADGRWTETYNDEDYTFFEFEQFAFSHLIGGPGSAFGGYYWDGFTICNSGDNTNYGALGNSNGWVAKQWGNMAGGGIKTDAAGNVLKDEAGKVLVGQGIPYLVAYWGYFMESMGTRCLQSIITDGNTYEAVGLYVNAHPWPYYGNIAGDGFASGFTAEGDYFKLIIHGLDADYNETGKSVEHYLAKYEGGQLIQSANWEWVDLSSLGKIAGLYYTMETSDDDPLHGPNTAVYFCMDKLQVRIPQEKVAVTITMNAVSPKIKLENKQTGESIDVGDAVSNKYSFDAAPGDYILSAYASNGTTLNGTIELTITGDDSQAFQFYTITTGATNSGWILGTDYTIDLSVLSREGEARGTTLGVSTTANRATFLVYSGDTFYVQFVPSDVHIAEGYLNYSSSATITGNITRTGEVPMGYKYMITVPEGASSFVGVKGSHFQKLTEFIPVAKTTNDGKTVYEYLLAGKQQYNYRISQPGKVTYADIFTMATTAGGIEITSDMLEGDPKAVNYDVGANGGYNVADVYLNINEKGYLKLDTEQTFQIVNIRAWQTTNTITGNYFIEPDYHYTVINESGEEDNSIVEIDKNGLLTTKANGTAIVLVTYDAINVASAIGGPFWGAIWPENTGVFVVSVGAESSDIAPNMFINEALNPTDKFKVSATAVDAELDVFYYLTGTGGYEFTFTPTGAITSVTLAQPVVGANIVSYNGFGSNGVVYNGDGSYTVQLIHGRNIVKLSSASGDEYQVLTAKEISYTVTNTTGEDGNVKPGDKVSIRFNTLYHPAHKLAGIYNMSASIQYMANGSTVAGPGNQYTFANAVNSQTVSVDIPTDYEGGTFDLVEGVIKASGYGDPYGTHREITLKYGRNPNFTAISCTAYFGALPAISISLAETGTSVLSVDRNKIAVYPNPFADYIMIDAEIDSKLTIYDFAGRAVLVAAVKVGNNRIETSNLAKGIYVVKLGTESVTIVK